MRASPGPGTLQLATLLKCGWGVEMGRGPCYWRWRWRWRGRQGGVEERGGHVGRIADRPARQGAPWKKNDESDVHLPQPQNK
jgi:hypothetical protein